MLKIILNLLFLLLRSQIRAKMPVLEHQIPPVVEGRESLYDPAKDSILETFGNVEFDRLIYNKPKAFFVQFYSAWCGHCRHFAPIFKKFAKRIEPWSKYVAPVAVNCGADSNFEFCRQHDIQAYPTLKFFKIWSSNETDGVQFSDERVEIHQLTSGLARFMALEAQNSTPTGWPKISFENLDPKLSWKDGKDYQIFLILSKSMLSEAYQILLDFDQFKKIDIRLLDFYGSDLARRFLKHENQVPGLVIFNKNDKEVPIYVSKSKLNVDEIGRIIDQQTTIDSDRKVETIETTTTIAVVEKKTPQGRLFVHKADLLSALWHILYRDAGKFPILDTVKLSAMKEFLEVVLKYFPSNDDEKRFLFNLLDFLNGFPESEMKSEHWISKLDDFQQQTGHPLPEKEKFVACRGSSTKFRGFTCAVWMLFHTLTVNAYKIDGSSPNFRPRRIILALKRYVTDIFGCTECGKHFKGETEDLMQEVQKSRDVVLYLWKVHNNVNRRLKGQKSEDPAYPKHQFPSVDLCPRCQDARTGLFDEDIVLEFLLKFYSNLESEPREAQIAHVKHINPKFKKVHLAKNENFFNSMDVSLCLLFWATSLILVLFIFFYFKSRKFKQKCLKTYFKMNIL